MENQKKYLDQFAIRRILANANPDEVINALVWIGILNPEDKYAHYWRFNDYISVIPLPYFLKEYLNKKIKKSVEEWILTEKEEKFQRERMKLKEVSSILKSK